MIVNNLRYIQIISFLVFLYTNSISAQFAIISDPDGYVNIRSEAQKGSNISDKLNSGFPVYCYSPKNTWISIDYFKNNKDLSGYVYKDRVKYVSEYTKIPIIKQTQNNFIFKKDSLNITFESKKFDPKTAKLTYLKNYKSVLDKINGKKIWGTDGDLPRTTYKLITVEIGNKAIEFPKDAFDDLFEPNFYYTKINYNQKNDILYISSSNGDGAGGYEVLWIIEKGKYKERKIAFNF